MSEDYYSKVVYDFINYKEFKQRCKHIEETKSEISSYLVNQLMNKNKGIDYSKPSVQTSNHSDPTAGAVLNAVVDTRPEYLEKISLVKRVERAYEGLDPVEQFVMDKKYKTGRILEDKFIYTHPNFPYGRTKYYEIKDEAVRKAARIVGYLKNNHKIIKNELLVNSW